MSVSFRTRLERARLHVQRQLRTEAKAARTESAWAQGGLAFLIAFGVLYVLSALGAQ